MEIRFTIRTSLICYLSNSPLGCLYSNNNIFNLKYSSVDTLIYFVKTVNHQQILC